MPNLSARPQSSSTRETAYVELRGSLTTTRDDCAVVPLLVPERNGYALDHAMTRTTPVRIVKAVELAVPGSRHTAGLVLTVQDADAAEQLAAALVRAAELLRTTTTRAKLEEDPEGDGSVPRLPAEPFPAVRVPVPVDVEPPSFRPATHTREEWDAAVADAERRAAATPAGWAFLEPSSLYGDGPVFAIHAPSTALAAARVSAQHDPSDT